MLLSSLVQGLEYDRIQGNLDVEIQTIAFNDQDVVENSVFVAISGFTGDGHLYIDEAVKKGATAVILEKDVPVHKDITVLSVTNSRKALAGMSANFYHNPSDELNMIGITGTNGKTSTSYFIKSIFEEANEAIGVIGTMGTLINDKLIETKNTTPESLDLQKSFVKMAESGVDNCMMEVSSHALDLDRVAFTSFNTGIFTNLSPDHLELHKSMDEYFEAKAKLFEMTKDVNIINVDDKYGRKLADRVKEKQPGLITYGIKNAADIYPTSIDYAFDGTTYTVNTPEGNFNVSVHLPGEINVYNSLAAIACAYANDIAFETIQKGIEHVEGIKGRMEMVYKNKDFRVIVDFSHTEEALEKALNTIRPYVKGRLLLVFGVYADNSESGKSKRAGMAKVASRYADLSIVTSDNPKQFDPGLIIKEITEAMDKHQGVYQAVVDREEAIQYAIEISEENDTILLAGKGHETTQVIGDREIPFNETDIVLETIRRSEQPV
ncbi:UDP-N-acetylmuramoyl-L-alanyl-D-glutamate--2,6-diaminopimelate ligase [Virgibacillus ainsalahensis]